MIASGIDWVNSGTGRHAGSNCQKTWLDFRVASERYSSKNSLAKSCGAVWDRRPATPRPKTAHLIVRRLISRGSIEWQRDNVRKELQRGSLESACVGAIESYSSIN